jgi:YfiH family protein
VSDGAAPEVALAFGPDGAGATLPGGGCWFTAAAAGDFTDPTAGELDALAASLGLEGRAFARSTQVHGSAVRFVAGPADAGDGEEFDGQVTCSREVLCAVRTADCLPVALFSPSAAGVIHAGWRGLEAGVLGAGVEAMESAGAGPLAAVIGPGARSCCYEVGDEVHEAFAALGQGARKGQNADLPWVADRQLRAAGVRQVVDVGVCTICASGPKWHSHRRDGAEAGRSLALAWRS